MTVMSQRTKRNEPAIRIGDPMASQRQTNNTTRSGYIYVLTQTGTDSMKASRKSHSDPTQYDARFWKKVDQAGDDECWLWQGCTGADGYGKLARTQENGKQKQWMAHRYAFIQTHGAINPELTIDHLCRVRNCCNPSHLEEVTRSVNAKRARAEFEGSQTHCLRGHPFSGDNLVVRNGKRHCRTCIRAAGKMRYPADKVLGRKNSEIKALRVRNRELEKRIAENKGHDYRAELQSVKSSLTAMKRSRDYVLNENRRLKQGDVLVEQKRQTDIWRQRAKLLRKTMEAVGLDYRFGWDAETGEILEPMSPEEMTERKRAKHRERMANDPEYAERKRATGRKSDAKRASYRVRNRGNRRKSKAQSDLFEPSYRNGPHQIA